MSGVAGIGYRGLPFEAAGGVMDSGEWFEDGVSTPSLQSMSERSDSENQDCDTASNESRERPLNQGVDDVGEARAGFSVQGWRQAVNADGGMEWLAAWTGDWEGARKYYRWANEDLEELADCWVNLALMYMRRKLGGGLLRQVMAEQGLGKAWTRAKVARGKMHRMLDGVLCMEHRIARLQMAAHWWVGGQAALHRKGARSWFTQTECEVGVRHRGAKSDTERSKQKKEKQNEVQAQVQVQVQVAARSKQKGQKQGQGQAQGRAEAQAQATVLVQEQVELFWNCAEVQAAVQAQAQVKGHTLARTRVADRHGGQLGQEQAQVKAEALVVALAQGQADAEAQTAGQAQAQEDAAWERTLGQVLALASGWWGGGTTDAEQGTRVQKQGHGGRTHEQRQEQVQGRTEAQVAVLAQGQADAEAQSAERAQLETKWRAWEKRNEVQAQAQVQVHMAARRKQKGSGYEQTQRTEEQAQVTTRVHECHGGRTHGGAQAQARAQETIRVCQGCHGGRTHGQGQEQVQGRTEAQVAVLAQGQAVAEAQTAGQAQVEAHTRAWARVAEGNGGLTQGQVQARRIQEIRGRAQAKAGAVAQVQGGLTHGMPLARAQVERLDASAFIAQVEEAGNKRWRDMMAAHDKELSEMTKAETEFFEMDHEELDWNLRTDWNFTKLKTKTNGKKKVTTKKKEWRNPQSGVTRDPGKPV